jgi:predicted glycosyltransferase
VAVQGMQEMLHPDELTSASLRTALDRLLERKPPSAAGDDFRGSERAADILAELAGASDSRTAPVVTAASIALQAARA